MVHHYIYSAPSTDVPNQYKKTQRDNQPATSHQPASHPQALATYFHYTQPSLLASPVRMLLSTSPAFGV